MVNDGLSQVALVASETAPLGTLSLCIGNDAYERFFRVARQRSLLALNQQLQGAYAELVNCAALDRAE